MDKKTRRRVKGTAIFVVFLALAATIVQFQNQGAKKPSFNFKPSDNEYRDLRFINKAQITFSAENVANAQSGIGKIIEKNGKQKIRKQNEGGFGAYIFTIPQADLEDVLSEMKLYGSIGSQVEQIDTSLVNLDYDSESARLASYEKELGDLGMVRFPSEVQNRRKETLHSLIQQSRHNLDKLKDGDNVLLYVTLRPKQKNSNLLETVKSLTINYFTWLVIFTVGIVLVYFGSKLLMYFLSAIGIKGINASGLGGSYNYGGYGTYSNYAKYSSSYGGYGKSSRRKIKRVYKDKGATTPETEDTEDK